MTKKKHSQPESQHSWEVSLGNLDKGTLLLKLNLVPTDRPDRKTLAVLSMEEYTISVNRRLCSQCSSI